MKDHMVRNTLAEVKDIPLALERLNDRVKRMDDAVMELYGRLLPALATSAEVATDDRPWEAYKSQVASSIGESIHTLDILIDRVNSVINDLQV